jgi:hypothetical protein
MQAAKSNEILLTMNLEVLKPAKFRRKKNSYLRLAFRPNPRADKNKKTLQRSILARSYRSARNPGKLGEVVRLRKDLRQPRMTYLSRRVLVTSGIGWKFSFA